MVRIGKWFDHKWLGYSGKSVVHMSLHWTEAALDECFQDQLTLPPFNPKQIRAEYHRQRLQDGTYGPPKKKKRIHAPVFKSSHTNLQNRLTAFPDSALILWFSANSQVNQHASVMVYTVDAKTTSA